MIRLVVADDHPIVRAGLHRIVADCPDMEVVGETDDGNTLLDVLEATDADIVLLDIAMPGLPFLDLLKLLRERWPRLRTLIVSTYSEDQYAVRALRAGAAGYLTKQRSPDELAAAVRRVYRGGRYVSQELAETLASQLDPEYEQPSHDLLSSREHRVLCRLAAGKAIKEIAAELSLSPKTVSTYRARVLQKLHLKTTAELIRYAVENDLTQT